MNSYDLKTPNVVYQYVVFTKVCNEQIALYGRKREALLEAIHICKDRNVLKEYLSSKEKEVVDIMMVLYDEQEVMKSYVESEVYDSQVETAKRMLEDGALPMEKIAQYSGLPIEMIRRLSDDLQLA